MNSDWKSINQERTLINASFADSEVSKKDEIQQNFVYQDVFTDKLYINSIMFFKS
jgi:hypothetical protein